MLLLTSVILLIGFIALSTMVIRVAQLPEETAQDTRSPIDLEADAVAAGVRHLMLRTHERVPISDAGNGGHAAFAASAEASLDTIIDLEKGRGFRFTWADLECTAPGAEDDVDISVTVTLQDLTTRIRVTITQGFSSTDPMVPLACA